MAHKDWCGRPCRDCKSPCDLDHQIPCSPDCEDLSSDGIPDSPECLRCDAVLRDDNCTHCEN